MTEEVSIRDTLEKTMASIEERDEKEEEVKEPPAEEPKDEAPTEEGAAEEAPEPEKKEPVRAEAKETPKAPEVDKELANPPSTWTAKGKSKWATIDPEIRKEIKRRESASAEGIRQMKETAATGERFSKTIAPYQAFLKSKGVAPEAALDGALNLAFSLSSGTPQERGAIIRRIAQQYGADLSQPDQQTDPLEKHLAPLRSKIDQLERERLNSQFLSTQQQQTQLSQTIESFASETDDTGQLAHPYFDNVRDLMAALLDSGSASTLKDAYALAVETHPQTRDIVRATNAQRDAQKKQAESQERAAKLKRNQQVNFTRTPTHPSKTAAHGSMRETIESTYERLIPS